MPYTKTIWQDQFRNGEGVIVQQGTPVNADNLNKMEEGIENAVSKDGGDTITGGVKFKNPTSGQKNGGRITAGNGGTSVDSIDDLSNENGNRQELKVNTVGGSDKNTAVQIKRTTNGQTETFDVLHSGNKDSISPSDIGAAPASHGTHVSYGTASPSQNGTASAGSATTVSRSDHVHPTDDTRAPKSHNSTGTDYGVGNNTEYGHLKLSDATNSSSGVGGGVASTPAATKAAYDLANTAKQTAENAQRSADGKAPSSHGNHVPTTESANNARFLRNDNQWQTVTPANIGAVPTGRKVNNKPLSSDISLGASDVGAVPTGRTVNGKALSSDITLNASDVGAAPAYTCGLDDLTAGASELATGKLYFVYE